MAIFNKFNTYIYKINEKHNVITLKKKLKKEIDFTVILLILNANTLIHTYKQEK